MEEVTFKIPRHIVAVFWQRHETEKDQVRITVQRKDPKDDTKYTEATMKYNCKETPQRIVQQGIREIFKRLK